MAKTRPRKAVRAGPGKKVKGAVVAPNGGPPRPARRRITLPFKEAAAMLGISQRTLMRHLKRTNAACVVKRVGRPKLDEEGFYGWCRAQGFQGAGRLKDE